MSEPFSIRSGRIEEFVGTDVFPLELKIKELRLLQASLDSGPSAILTRLQYGEWKVDDIIETVRLGLIGGGMGHQEAKRLTEEYVCQGYLLQYLPHAIKVLMASLIGDTEDQPDAGEPQAPTTEVTIES